MRFYELIKIKGFIQIDRFSVAQSWFLCRIKMTYVSGADLMPYFIIVCRQLKLRNSATSV